MTAYFTLVSIDERKSLTPNAYPVLTNSATTSTNSFLTFKSFESFNAASGTGLPSSVCNSNKYSKSSPWLEPAENFRKKLILGLLKNLFLNNLSNWSTEFYNAWENFCFTRIRVFTGGSQNCDCWTIKSCHTISVRLELQFSNVWKDL